MREMLIQVLGLPMEQDCLGDRETRNLFSNREGRVWCAALQLPCHPLLVRLFRDQTRCELPCGSIR